MEKQTSAYTIGNCDAGMYLRFRSLARVHKYVKDIGALAHCYCLYTSDKKFRIGAYCKLSKNSFQVILYKNPQTIDWHIQSDWS